MKKSKVKSQKSKIYQAGFTLVEILIAVSILSISILATFTAVSNNLRGSNFAEDQVVAYYLADEGIEYVRNVRDQNGIANIVSLGSGGASVPWLTGLSQLPSDPCYNKVCYVDSPSATIASCSGSASTCPYLRVDCPSIGGDCTLRSGLYGYNPSWTLTQFQRSITINVISATEAVVSSTASWVAGGVSKDYSLSEILKDWQ